MNPDQDIDLGEVWNPTPEEFARYRAREIELAKANCEFLAREHGMASVKSSNTLHTRHTIRDAKPGKEECARRVALGSFTAGFQAMMAERAQ